MNLNITPAIPELETPVRPPKITRSSLTSHLRVNFPRDHSGEALEAAEVLQGEISATLRETELPATLAESIALLHQIKGSEPADKRGRQLKAARLEQLAKHVHALSQAPTPPPIDHKRFWKRTPAASALARVSEACSNLEARKG